MGLDNVVFARLVAGANREIGVRGQGCEVLDEQGPGQHRFVQRIFSVHSQDSLGIVRPKMAGQIADQCSPLLPGDSSDRTPAGDHGASGSQRGHAIRIEHPADPVVPLLFVQPERRKEGLPVTGHAFLFGQIPSQAGRIHLRVGDLLDAFPVPGSHRERGRRSRRQSVIHSDVGAGDDSQHSTLGPQPVLLRPNLVAARHQVDDPVLAAAGENGIEHVLIEVSGIHPGRGKGPLGGYRPPQNGGSLNGLGGSDGCRSTCRK